MYPRGCRRGAPGVRVTIRRTTMRAPAADGYPWAALFPPQCTLGGVRVRGAPSLPRTRSLAGHLPQERGPAGGGGRRAARSLHGRDRQPLPVAAGVSGATQRAGAGGRGGGVHRGAAPSGSGRLSFRGPAVARLLDDIAAAVLGPAGVPTRWPPRLAGCCRRWDGVARPAGRRVGRRLGRRAARAPEARGMRRAGGSSRGTPRLRVGAGRLRW